MEQQQQRQSVSLSETKAADERSSIPSRQIPAHFCCPITLEVMVDPVIDREGNTYDRHAIVEWLKKEKNSPLSREPLAEGLLVPNIALRNAIHEFMDPEWVMKNQPSQELSKQIGIGSNGQLAVHDCQYRFLINTYLADISNHIGQSLKLNEEGVCAFVYQTHKIVIEVPKGIGCFYIYTYQIVPSLSSECKDRILQLNYLQQQTRGGCISVTKVMNDGNKGIDLSEVLFSYTDRVMEISSHEFKNVLENFTITTVGLHQQIFVGSDDSSLTPPWPNNGRSSGSTSACGMAL